MGELGRVDKGKGQDVLDAPEERPDLPLLVRAGLAHVQFETIHPFLDGNGHLGRLLITLLLCASGALQKPILCLSLFFKARRETYYELLTRVRTEGAWEEWIEFFLTGVKETAEQAVSAARRILAVIDEDRRRIEAIGRPGASVLRAFQLLQTKPLFPVKVTAKALGTSFPTAHAAVEQLEKLGIMRETTGRERHRLYIYTRYLEILGEGTEPLARARG